MEHKELTKSSELRRGIIVLIALAVLTIIEYVLGYSESPAVFLWIIALLKAAAVLWFFMHLSRVFGSEEGGHR